MWRCTSVKIVSNGPVLLTACAIGTLLPGSLWSQEMGTSQVRAQIIDFRKKVHIAQAEERILELEEKILQDPVPEKALKELPPEIRETAERITRESKIFRKTHEDRKEALDELE